MTSDVPIQVFFFTASDFSSFCRNMVFSSLWNPPWLQPVYLKLRIHCVSSLAAVLSAPAALNQPTSAAHTMQSPLSACCVTRQHSCSNRGGEIVFQKLTKNPNSCFCTKSEWFTGDWSLGWFHKVNKQNRTNIVSDSPPLRIIPSHYIMHLLLLPTPDPWTLPWWC